MRPDVLGKILSKWEVRPVSIDHADCHSNYIDSSSAEVNCDLLAYAYFLTATYESVC